MVLLSGPGGSRRAAATTVAPPGREPTPKGGGRQAPRGDDWSRGGGSSRREPTPRGRGRQAHHGKGGRRARSPAESLERKLVRALRRGEFGFRGSFERGGYLSHAALKEAFQCSEELWQSALRRDRVGRKSRIDTRQPGFLRALQGHSTDCGHDLAFMADLRRSHGKYIYHGTDVHVVESIAGAPTQWSNAIWTCCVRQASGSSKERTVFCLQTLFRPRPFSGCSRLTTTLHRSAGRARS